jgi:uncharacterized protein (TIGR00369 family)
MTAYPPDEHMLRDLRFTFDHNPEGRTSRAWMPVVPEICTDQGHARAGALATLVDVIGGGLAANAAAPNWIATADLTLHVVAGASPGSVVEARGSVLRAGRTTVVIEVALVADDAREIGSATMSFSVLARREINPDVDAVRNPGPSTMATAQSRMRAPFLDALSLTVVDAAAGVVDVPVADWSRNSMAAMQGGVVATVVDAAAEVAVRAATNEPLIVSDLQVTYLGFGRVGPVRTRTEVLVANDAWAAARVDLADAGAEHREMTTASAVATRGFAQ